MKESPEEILVWDTETGGVDVENDRILTCYAARIRVKDGSVIEDWSWVIDPGTEVSGGAAAVHGMTTEWVREHGSKDPERELRHIYSILGDAQLRNIPIVAYNLRYDLSILHHELRRYGFEHGVTELVDKATFLDPLVWDKARDKYRRGNRKLQTVCEHYGIEFNESEAHAAEYDVLKTGELCLKFIRREKLGVAELQDFLRESKQEQDESLEAYFAKSGKKNDDGSKIIIDRGWPLITKKGN